MIPLIIYRIFSLKTSRIVFTIFVCCLYTELAAQKSEWKQLFNGKDLTGWDTYLRPKEMIGYIDEASGLSFESHVGLNNDPFDVFTINDNVIRISGEVWGAITSKEEFSNYHLRFETKWGEQKYYPKDTTLRDAGLLFHCTGPFNFAFKCWMRSLEMQIEENNIGDYYDVFGGIAEFQISDGISPLKEKVSQHDALAPLKRFSGRVHRSGNFESPHGEWTRGELIARHADAVFIVNGFVVNRLYNIFRSDINRQVTSGKLQFQSESAEHFIRDISIRPLHFSPFKSILTSRDSVVISEVARDISISNSGDPIEIIAVELIGKYADQLKIELPEFPLIIKKNNSMKISVSSIKGNSISVPIKMRLESVSGPVPDFEVTLFIE